MASPQKKSSVLKFQIWGLLGAALGSYIFGSIANLIWNNDIRCAGLGDTGGCSDANIFFFVFGFYLGLFFCISFVHFAFIKQPSRYYYIVIGLLLFTSLILIELFWMALGFTATGVLLGLVLGYFLETFKAK